MASEKWTMMRVKRTTMEQLAEVQRLFNSQYMKGQLPDVPCHDRFGISLDTVLQILITRDNDHRQRSRSNSRKRKDAPGLEGDNQGKGQ